jgi:hypothetical protein
MYLSPVDDWEPNDDPQPDPDSDSDAADWDDHESLSPADRNPSLCR